MRIDECPTRPVAEHGSEGAHIAFLARGGGGGVVRIELEPGGRLALHPAAAPQLLVVVEGEGTVATDEAEPVPVSAGAAVWWARGELHETSSETGLVALVVEADGLDPMF